ncbi:MAG TPA: hypothetical protein VLC74_09705, partial [Rhizomicrobium sp.]|nr:hypothetical protein [Rhizomicrobium sp.]
MDEELNAAHEGQAGQIAAGPAAPPAPPERLVEGAPEKPAEPKGPPDRSAEYFSDIAHRNSRREAVKEYRRTLDEFRQTGAIQEKEWADFAHLTNPPDIQLHVFDAHQRAALDIEHWQDEQAEAEQESAREELRAQLLGEKARREEATRSPEIATQDSRAEISQSPVAPPPTPTPTAPLPQGGLLRGVPFNPHAPGRNARWEPAIPQLELAPVPERLPASEDQTEALL